MNGKEDCETLLNAVLPFAQRMLAEFGEFYPYGGYMSADGKIVDVGAKNEDNNHPKSTDLIYLLRSGMKEMAAKGECTATAIVFDVRVVLPGSEVKTNAIQIWLDHVGGYSAEVFIPYHRDESGGVVYASMFAQKGAKKVFGDL